MKNVKVRGSVLHTVLKTGPADRFNREPGASLVRLKASKPVNNRSTTGKPAKNRGWTENFQKNGSMPGSVFKTMGNAHMES